MYSVNSGAKLSKNLVTYAIPAKKIIEKPKICFSPVRSPWFPASRGSLPLPMKGASKRRTRSSLNIHECAIEYT